MKPIPIPKRLNHEIGRYLLTGGVSFSIDTSVYFALTLAGLASPFWAKRVSYVLGSIWAFFANKHFTFQRKGFRTAEPVLFTILYFLGFLLNGFLHDTVLRWTASKVWAFSVASVVVICANYVGQKWVVFRNIPSADK